MKLAKIALAVIVAMGTPAYALDAAQVTNPKKQTTLKLYVTPKEAYDMKMQDSKVIFIDIRTPEETMFVGMTDMVDANIPYKVFPTLDDVKFDDKTKAFQLEANSNFQLALTKLVELKGGNKDSTIVLMCRSGDRSAAAANLLATVGYTKVYSAVEGFEGDLSKTTGRRDENGWKNAGLPWGYSLVKEKVYHTD